MGEKAGSSGEYRIVPVESQPFLEADQNFIDQRPFLDLPGIVGADFFKDPKDLSGIAAFVRFIMVISPKRYQEEEVIRPLRKYISSMVKTRVFKAWDDVKRLIDDTPYLEKYIRDFFLRRKKPVFSPEGWPIPESTEEVETFVRYQSRMIQVEKAATLLGLEEESPGLATAAGVRGAIDETRASQPNRYWRLVTRSEALR